MTIVILTNEGLKAELTAQGVKDNATIHYVNTPGELLKFRDADFFIDLIFQPTDERIKLLEQLSPKPVLVNTILPLQPTKGWIRINGWNSFLGRAVIEGTCADIDLRSKAVELFNIFNKTIEWTADIPGFISARVVSMIINEAYFTLEDRVSTKEEIDTAMKLGTNYPYGPFEWSKKIGLKNIYELLSILATANKRYEPAALLKKEADGQ